MAEVRTGIQNRPATVLETMKSSAQSSEEYFERTIERSVEAAVLHAAGPTRRQVLAHWGQRPWQP